MTLSKVASVREMESLQGLKPLKLSKPLYQHKTVSNAEILFLSASILAQAMEDIRGGVCSQSLYTVRLKEAIRLMNECGSLTLDKQDVKRICKGIKIANPLN